MSSDDDFKILGTNSRLDAKDSFRVLGTNRRSNDFEIVTSAEVTESIQTTSKEYLSGIVQYYPANSPKPNKGPSGQIYEVDVATRKSVQWVQKFIPGKVHCYYKVFEGGAQTCASRRFRYERERGRTIELDIWFDIQGVVRGCEVIFVEALAGYGRLNENGISQPNNVFLEFIENTITEVFRAERTSESFCSADLERLKMGLATRARNIFGLSLVAGVNFPNHEGVTYFSSPTFKTFVSNEPIQFRYDVGLFSEGSGNLYVPPSDLKANIDLKIKGWLAEVPTIDDIYMRPETVRSDLITFLSAYLSTHALRIQHLALHTNFSLISNIQSTFEHAVIGKVEPETSVTIRHQLNTDLISVAKFQKAGVGDFDLWIGNILESCTNKILFGKTYTDLLLDFDTIQEGIKNAVNEKTANAGLKVRQLVTIPDLPLRKLIQEGFRLSVTRGMAPATNSSPGSQGLNNSEDFIIKESEEATWAAGAKVVNELGFETKDSRVRFPCSIHVEGRLRSLEPLKNYLSPHWEWEKKMIDLISKKVEDVTRNLFPQQLFLEFEVSKGPGSPSPSDSIRNSIKDALSLQYNAECYWITINRLESDFSKTLDRLTAYPPQKLSVEIIPYENCQEMINFHILYRVTGISQSDNSSWGRFQNTSRNAVSVEGIMGTISTTIEESIKQNLAAVSESELRTRRIDEIQVLKTDVIGLAAKKTITEVFGLSVEFLTLRRDPSKVDDNSSKNNKLIEEQRTRMLQSRLRALESEYTKLVTDKSEIGVDSFSGNEDERALIDQRLKEIEKEVDQLETAKDNLNPHEIEEKKRGSSKASDYRRLGNDSETDVNSQ